VQFLVPIGDFSSLVDPDQGVFRFGGRGGLVDADTNGELVLFCRGEEALDEFRVVDGFAELQRWIRIDVV
jgi:hypothetical protein